MLKLYLLLNYVMFHFIYFFISIFKIEYYKRVMKCNEKFSIFGLKVSKYFHIKFVYVKIYILSHFCFILVLIFSLK